MLLGTEYADSGFRQEVRDQTNDLRRTWAQNKSARRQTRIVFGAAFAVILLAILVDIARFLDLHHMDLRFLSLMQDQSLPEIVMDATALVAAVLFLLMARRSGLRSFVVLAAMLAFVALDDFFSIHEAFGAVMVTTLGLQDIGRIAAQAQGELVVFALFGLCFLPLAVWSLKALNVRDLAVYLIYGLLFGIFVFFAAGVDLVHSAVENSILRRLLGWTEDGGEVIGIALLTSVAIVQFHGRQIR